MPKENKKDGAKILTTAVAALRNTTIKRITRIRKTLQVLLRGGRPALLEIGAVWFFAEEVTDLILAV